VETDLSQAKRLLDTNLLGIIDINQTFFPELLKAKGTIVNVGSAATHIPMPMNAVYCASKAGLYAYSEVMRVEVAPLGVKVQFIQVGNVKTNILKNKNHLGEDSLWAPVSDVFEKRQEIAANTGAEPAVFAKELARKLLAGHKNVLWVGESAWMVRLVNQVEHWLPFQLWPFMWSREYQMDRIKAM
jgi:1-acylglycerone phosphate reductase